MSKLDLGSQLTNATWYILWFFISLAFYQSLIALGLGILGLFLVSLYVLSRNRFLENIPFHVFNYNYTIGLPKSQLICVVNLNKKKGRRFEYWRGHGRFL